MGFRNRSDAGRRLASRLEFLRGADVVVLGLPRGGVPVAAEVASALGVPLAGRIAVIVDDGIATGSTARAACQVARALGAARVVLAVPVAPHSADQAMSGDADEVICLEMPERFLAIGEWYEDFAQTSDEEVVALLRATRDGTPAGPEAGFGPGGGAGEPSRSGEPSGAR